MRIEEDLKLDYSDVLFRPKRSTLSSRKDVDLERTYKFKYSKNEWSGIPVMAANMDGVGELEVAEMLSDFYTDLNDEKLSSRFAIFHQRYSTNTFPSWDLAQPFRTLAHNGEINTVKGNINWMKIHEQDMSSKLFKNVKDLKPVIRSSSDSGALDNVFELLTHSGKLAPLIKLMMIPDSWSKRSKTVPKTIKTYLIF